jgi:hypothetical protein
LMKNWPHSENEFLQQHIQTKNAYLQTRFELAYFKFFNTFFSCPTCRKVNQTTVKTSLSSSNCGLKL